MKITPQRIHTIQEMLTMRAATTTKVGFVPTMGYLHEGHLSLVRKARKENDVVIVSIFVNPTQFGPNEDLSRYPQDIERDIVLLKEVGVDIIFTPNAESMYPERFQTYVDPLGLLVTEVEGAIRPGHFRGMATIVLKFFNIIKPTNVYFGQKDAQQALIVEKMITDLNLPITFNVEPTVREKDGLAMSSRNVYLTPDERKAAAVLYKALQKGKEIFDKNLDKNVDIVRDAISEILVSEPILSLEYIEIRNSQTFEKHNKLAAPSLMLIAVKIGKTRLIDNFLLQPNGTWNTGRLV